MRRRLFLIVAAMLAVASPTLADTPSAPSGWSTQQYASSTCAVSGPVDGSAALSFLAESGELMLLINVPGLPDGHATYPLTISVNGGPGLPFSGIGSDGVVGVPVGSQFFSALGATARLEITVAGHTYAFAVRDGEAAADAAARCAGVPSMAERERNAPSPIPHAGHWLLSTHMPGAPAGFCTARINGPEVDTVLMLNNRGALILVAGHPGWASWAVSAHITLAIDGAAPDTLTGNALDNLVLVETTPAMRERLRGAKTLDWALPNGRFHAEVDGLGQALDAVTACNHP